MLVEKLRHVTAMSLSLLLTACTSRTFEKPRSMPEKDFTDVHLENPLLKVDIVFMIDNSNSMRDEQQNLIRNFGRFMEVLLTANPDLGPPDVHIAVVSSNLGAPGGAIGGCAGGGDNGAFQYAPRGAGGTCTALPRGSFIASNGDSANFDGDISDVFSCIAELGVEGCGMEHQLASVRRALDGDPFVAAPEENAGFLRADARLGIIFITDEDDCSAPPDTDLFTGDSRLLSDPYGPLKSFRCNEYGHLCGGQPPPRAAASGLVDCHSNETASSKLTHVGEFVDFFRGLKGGAPDMLRVAAITGRPTSYGTRVITPSDGSPPFIEVVPTCGEGTAGGGAAPAVRLQEFISAFGSAGLIETICDNDFRPAMEHIAQSLVERRAPCVRGTVYDDDAARAGMQANCVASQSVPGEGTSPGTETVIPACDDNGHAPPCWTLQADPTCATASPQGLALVVDRGGALPPPNSRVQFSCAVCATPDDPRCAP